MVLSGLTNVCWNSYTDVSEQQEAQGSKSQAAATNADGIEIQLRGSEGMWFA